MSMSPFVAPRDRSPPLPLPSIPGESQQPVRLSMTLWLIRLDRAAEKGATT